MKIKFSDFSGKSVQLFDSNDSIPTEAVKPLVGEAFDHSAVSAAKDIAHAGLTLARHIGCVGILVNPGILLVVREPQQGQFAQIGFAADPEVESPNPENAHRLAAALNGMMWAQALTKEMKNDNRATTMGFLQVGDANSLNQLAAGMGTIVKGLAHQQSKSQGRA